MTTSLNLPSALPVSAMIAECNSHLTTVNANTSAMACKLSITLNAVAEEKNKNKKRGIYDN